MRGLYKLDKDKRDKMLEKAVLPDQWCKGLLLPVDVRALPEIMMRGYGLKDPSDWTYHHQVEQLRHLVDVDFWIFLYDMMYRMFDDDGDEEDLDREYLERKGWSEKLCVFLPRALGRKMYSRVWP
jgi:hypothetical protein